MEPVPADCASMNREPSSDDPLGAVWAELQAHPKYAALVRAHAEELERLGQRIKALNADNAEAYSALATVRKEREELRGG